ncbi:MAG: hypothetical protein NVSMB64_18870 [Candidatus Velthaea sp.]
MKRSDLLAGAGAALSLTACGGGAALVPPSTAPALDRLGDERWIAGASSITASLAGGARLTGYHDATHLLVRDASSGAQYSATQTADGTTAHVFAHAGRILRVGSFEPYPGRINFDNGATLVFHGGHDLAYAVFDSGKQLAPCSLRRDSKTGLWTFASHAMTTTAVTDLVVSGRRVEWRPSCGAMSFYGSAFGAASIGLMFLPGLQVASVVTGVIGGVIGIWAYFIGC